MNIFKTLPITIYTIFLLFGSTGLSAQNSQAQSCDPYLPPQRSVDNTSVGPSSCLMHEAGFSFEGKKFFRVDIGIDGRAEGYVKKSGPYHEYMTSAPDLLFNQAATSSGKTYLAIADYERMKGTAVFLIYPINKADWNGKLWVTAHGRGRSFKNGSLKVWNEYMNFSNPTEPLNKIEKSMLSKGYALAITNRTSVESIGELNAVLNDGTRVDWVAFNETASLIKDFTFIVENVLEMRLGNKPIRTYLFGHSAGARTGRSINYSPGVNKGPNGDTVFDGFLMGDSATGLWLPVIMENGRDVLFDEEREKEAFMPQIEVGHQMNTKIWTRAPERPDWVSNNYLVNKRNNARILMEKGFGPKFRVFEVRQISHANGAELPNGRKGKIRILDVSRFVDSVIDMLDNLVEGKPVPASRSDWAVLGDVDGDGIVENPAISMPEVSCPLGVFYPYPVAGSTTSFAGFTGEGVEPLDAQDNFVDMNRNGVWDFRETPTEAWRRLGLITNTEEFSREKYINCIRNAAESMHNDGFLNKKIVEQYIKEAESQDLTPARLDNF